MPEEPPSHIESRGHSRVFSLEQANRSLPLLRRIVQDLQQSASRVRDLQEQFDSLQGQARADQAQHCLRELKTSRERYEQYSRELAEVGCSLADERIGAVEFPSVIAGRAVVLSWRPEEPEVAFWHDPGQGASARQPLTELSASTSQDSAQSKRP